MTRTLNTVIITILLSTLLLTSLPGTLLAATGDDDERWYQIELVIFENKNTLDATEIWAEDPGLPDQTQTVELTGHTRKPAPRPLSNQAPPLTNSTNETELPGSFAAFELLPEQLLTLTDSVERMTASVNYQPLLHIGWRQPVPERNDAQAIVIDTRKLLLHTTRIDDTTAVPDSTELETTDPAMALTTDTSATPLEATNALPPPSLYEQGPDEIVTEINENFVNGNLTLTRGRYLHLSLDLLYQRQPNTPQLFSFLGFGNTGNAPEHYRLQQQRRLKRGELHYFDHPKFGVLAVVTAVEQDEVNQVRTIPLKRQPR